MYNIIFQKKGIIKAFRYEQRMENPLKYNIATRYRKKLIFDLIKPKKKDMLLDVGCGLGYMASLLSKKCKTYGIDTDTKSIKLAKKVGDGNATFLVANALKMPFKGNTFDYVIASEVIEHVPDDNLFMKEIVRVTKKNGTIVLTTPSLEGLFKVSATCHKYGTEKHFKEGYKEKDLIKLFQKNGCKVKKVRYSMIFFTQLLINLVKLAYSAKEPSYKGQSDIVKVQKSAIFKIYKSLFFIQLLFMYLDCLLSKFMKGSNILILAEKQ